MIILYARLFLSSCFKLDSDQWHPGLPAIGGIQDHKYRIQLLFLPGGQEPQIHELNGDLSQRRGLRTAQNCLSLRLNRVRLLSFHVHRRLSASQSSDVFPISVRVLYLLSIGPFCFPHHGQAPMEARLSHEWNYPCLRSLERVP